MADKVQTPPPPVVADSTLLTPKAKRARMSSQDRTAEKSSNVEENVKRTKTLSTKSVENEQPESTAGIAAPQLAGTELAAEEVAEDEELDVVCVSGISLHSDIQTDDRTG